MKKLLLLLLMVPAMAWADKSKTVPFSAECFTYNDFIKQIEFFEEIPILIGVKEENNKENIVLISVLYNQQEDSFSVVQFNKNVGCFLTVGTKLKFNLKGLKIENLK